MGLKNAILNGDPAHNEKHLQGPPSDPGPDSATSPIKQPDSPSNVQPEIPEVGSTDAPGG
jgi:hypothetical protein